MRLERFYSTASPRSATVLESRDNLYVRQSRRLRWLIAAMLLPAGRAPLLSAQPRSPNAEFTRVRDLAAGKFLIAQRGLLDPNFRAAVVLLVQYDEHGVVGLVINRRTKVLLADAFPKLKGVKDRPDAVYLGGPVEPTGALALIRSQTRPKDAEHILADVYLTASLATLEKTLTAKTASSGLRVYVGYAGWTAEQLQKEVELGGWFIFPGDAAAVFDAHPESVWSRWIVKTEGQIAFTRSLYIPAALLPSAGVRSRLGP